MIYLCDAIFALNPIVVSIRGDVAYDVNEKEVTYDMTQAQAKLAELQAQEISVEEAQITAKQSALTKLITLGLTENEVKSLIG
jgi:hypothetical protein